MTTDYRLKAAKEAAAKVNAMLVATGQLRPSDLNKGRSKPGKSSDLFVEEVVINDAPMSARNFLTRSFTQEEISKMSGASVSTRGRYMTQEEIDNNTSNDRPLYLHIQGVNQQDVKVAVGRIMHLIMEHTHRKGNSHHHKGKGHRASSGQNAGGGSRQGDRSPRMDKANNESIEPINENKIFPQNVLREKVFLPSTANLNPVEIRIRLSGENNSNMKYIQDETGATIFMRGIGSGFIEPSTGMESQEALHFYLEHQNQDHFNQAKDLVVNLAQTILSQIHQEQSQEHIHPPPNAIPQQGFQQNHLGQIPLNGNVIPPPLSAVPPQIPAGNQTVLPAVTQQMPPGMIPTQLGVQVNSVQLPQAPQLLIPTQVPAPNTISTQSIQEIQQASVAHGAQLLQISVPSSIGGPSLVSQQLVQTSAGPQLVHLPHGTQIVSTLDGPRLVSLAPVSSASTAFITQSVQSNAVTDQQPLSVALSQTAPHPLPQPVPQPVPHPLPQNCNVSGFGQGETYVFDSEQRKFPSSPVIMTSTSNTFAFIPQEPLQQTVVPTTTLPVEISQSQQWHPSSNSVVLSHVCNTPAVADVTFAQTPHTQATFVRPPTMSHTSENFPCGDISNHPLTDPMRPSSEWNIDIGGKPNASHYLETTASASEVVRDSALSKDREDSLTSDPNRHVSDQRSPLKTSQYMWAQYPNVSYGSIHCVPHDKALEEGRNNETYNSIVGGSLQNEKEPQNNSSSSETFVKDDALQGTRHVLRNSPSAGGFSGEPKRRRSFKPKGDFHGPNRIMKREHDKPFPNRPAQVSLSEQFYNDDVNLRTSFDYSPSTSKMSAYPRSMRREDFHMRNRSEMGPYYGDPNSEKMRNPWIWNRNDRNAGIDPIAGPSQSSNYNHRSKAYDSPWESGIPGVQIGKEMPRPSEPLVNRNKFPKKKFNRLY